MRLFDIAAMLVDQFIAVQYATSIVFHTTDSHPVWGFDVTVEIPGRGSTTREIVLAADKPQHLAVGWVDELREQLVDLGGVVVVRDCSDCEVCGSEVVLATTFQDGPKFDPTDLAEVLAVKAGYPV